MAVYISSIAKGYDQNIVFVFCYTWEKSVQSVAQFPRLLYIVCRDDLPHFISLCECPLLTEQ